MNVMENNLTAESPAGNMTIFMASPDVKDKKIPVVIVFQEAFGVNSHIKDICRRVADQGFIALAPELYHRDGSQITFTYQEKDLFMQFMGRLTNQGLIDDTQACFSFMELLAHADVKNVFTLGFCMGGFTSMLVATQFQFRGAISFYGAGVVRERAGIGLKPFVDNLIEARCPLLLFYGENDVSIPESDRFAIRAKLDQAHISHEMMVFGKSDHGFFCDERKTYNPEASTLAWDKSIGWMKNLIN